VLLQAIAIDPSQLHDIEGWTQQDYRSFWRHVIAEFCHSIVLLDGWELSIGCVSEFAVAAHLGLKIYRQDLALLSGPEGFASIHEAVAQIEAEGFSASEIRPDLDSAIEIARALPLRQ
jgi:hypothetical protein